MLATRTVIPLLIVFLAGPVSAGISIDDPAGDTEIDGAPMGAAGAAYDLREVTIRQEAANLVLTIRLEEVPTAHDSAEFVVVFEGNGTWMAGYTALPYTDPAPRYQGGFACPATQDGFVNGSQSSDCIGIPDWSLEGNTYTVAVPLEFVQATHGTRITQAWAYSEITPYLKGTSRVDTTSKHGELVVQMEVPVPPDQEPPSAQEATGLPFGPVLIVALVLLVRRR